MNQRSNSLMEKLNAVAGKAKALLTKDYSVQDLRHLPNLLSQWWSNAAVDKTLQQDGEVSNAAWKANRGFDAKQALQVLQRIIFRQRKIVLLIGILIILGLLYQLLLAPYSRKVQDQLEMRPAQWSQLQSLIRMSKTTAASANAVSSNSMPSTVSLLDEQELQKILNVFTARGLKPSVFRLSTDNPPRIEFQASEVMFSVFLDALEELRTTWRLYPIQLSVLANGGAGMVSVSGMFSQYGSNATNTVEPEVAQ